MKNNEIQEIKKALIVIMRQNFLIMSVLQAQNYNKLFPDKDIKRMMGEFVEKTKELNN